MPTELPNTKMILTQNMVCAATEFGIGIVQEMAAIALQQKPGMSLKNFTQVMDQQLLTIKQSVSASISQR